MTWNVFHRRGEVLREVADQAHLRRDGLLPTDVPGVSETFTDDLDLVGALHLRWHQRMVGQIEQHQADRPMDLESAVREGWAAAARSLPGIRLIVDEALAHPVDEPMARALARATLKERAQLAMLAGLASGTDERSVAIGRRIEAEARELWTPGAPVPSTPDVDIARRPVTPVPAAAPARTTERPHAQADLPTHTPAGSPAFVRRLRAALSA